MAAKLTPWYPDTVKPVRPGVYERNLPSETWLLYSRWDGKHWYLNSLSPKSASCAVSHSSWQGILRWRGLAADPSKA